MRDIIAMVLAGGRVQELSVLTHVRSKASVPFGGRYRIIDFAISGLMRADLDRVGILSHYRPASLIDHLGSGEPWDFIGRGRGIKLLPPYVSDSDSQWYRGTGDAIYRNLNFIVDHTPRDVLIVSGDHIHNLDFSAMIEQHRNSGADLTMAVKEMDPSVGRGRFGFAQVDEQDRVVGYQEKPEQPRSNLVSLTVYLFKTQVLLEGLDRCQGSDECHHLYHGVLPQCIERDLVYAYRHRGYWNYTRSVDAYHQAHMELLGDRPAIRLKDWGIRTSPELRGLGDMPPARFDAGAQCADSVVSAGVHISGSVRGSVLSPGVRVEQGAVVNNSILLPNVVVRSGAKVDCVVADKHVVVGAKAQVGVGEKGRPNRLQPEALALGSTVIGKNTRVPPDAVVGRSCAVGPELSEDDWSSPELDSGECLGLDEGSTRE